MTNICRSYLWTTALLPEKYSYAQKVNADVCIIDLEDSVPTKHKDRARKLAIDFLEKNHNYKYGLRINSIRTSEGVRDINALLESKARPYMIVLPKVELPEEVVMVKQWLSNIPNLCFCATIETPRGMQNVYDIAKAGNSLKYLIWGSADLSAEMGVVPDWPGADQIRTQLVLAAAYGGIAVLDTAEFDLSNDAKLEEVCKRIKSLGVVGKACVHPRQVSTVNKTFRPSDSEIAEAQQMIQSHIETDDAVTIVHGKMAGPPMRKMARRILN